MCRGILIFEAKDKLMIKETKIGDVVCLKSNPKIPMTIERCGTIASQCTWLTKKGKLRTYSFDNAMLTYYTSTVMARLTKVGKKQLLRED
jgi:hypothetical protein